jgi:Tfp pilus assembly protein PilN
MRAVNLVPRDAAPSRALGRRIPVLVAGAGFAAVTAAAAMLVVSASGTVGDARSQLDSIEAALARIPTQEAPAVAPGTIAQERTDRAASLSAALASRAPVDSLLRELALVLPEDAWLTGLTATAPTAGATAGAVPGTPPPTATSPGVTIQGATYSHRAVARVLGRFSALPSLTGVRLTAAARVEPAVDPASKTTKRKKQKPVVTFTITATIRTGATT